MGARVPSLPQVDSVLLFKSQKARVELQGTVHLGSGPSKVLLVLLKHNCRLL